MENTNKIDEFAKACLSDNLESLIKENPKLNTNPKMATIFRTAYWEGCVAYVEFIRLMLEERDEHIRKLKDPTENESSGEKEKAM